MSGTKKGAPKAPKRLLELRARDAAYRRAEKASEKGKRLRSMAIMTLLAHDRRCARALARVIRDAKGDAAPKTVLEFAELVLLVLPAAHDDPDFVMPDFCGTAKPKRER